MLADHPVSFYMTGATLSVDVHSPASEILRYFSEYPVHHLPVVDASKVVGMLSSADVMKLDMFLPKSRRSSQEFLNQHINIETIMRRPAIAVGPNQSIGNAAELMAQHGIHALAVTDLDDHLLGIITTTDIMNAALHKPPGGAAQSDTDSARAHECTTDKLEAVLRIAARVSPSDGERRRLAEGLLELHRRNLLLNDVLECAKRYVRAGQDSNLHAALVAAIEKTTESSDRDHLAI